MILDEMLEELRDLRQGLASLPTINIPEELESISRGLQELHQGIANINRRYDGMFEELRRGRVMTQVEFEAAATEYREKKTAAEEAAAAVEEVLLRHKTKLKMDYNIRYGK